MKTLCGSYVDLRNPLLCNMCSRSIQTMQSTPIQDWAGLEYVYDSYLQVISTLSTNILDMYVVTAEADLIL